MSYGSKQNIGVLYDANGNPITSGVPADGIANAAVRGLDNRSFQFAFNGLTWDSFRNNSTAVALATANRTATTTSPNFQSFNAAGIWAALAILANPGAGETLQLAIYGVYGPNLVTLDVVTAPIVAGATSYGFCQLGAAAITDPPGGGITKAKTTKTIPPVFYVSVTHSASGIWNYRVDVGLCL